MPTITELQARFTASANGFLSEFKTVEGAIGNLPKMTEKATKKMTDDFNKVDKSLSKLDDALATAGDDFDVSKVRKGLSDAQKEFEKTGEVSKETLNNLNKEIKNVDFKSLPRDAQRAMTDINNSVKSVERQMNKLGDVKFLEGLPDDAKKAGAQLLELEKDVKRTTKALGSMDSGADFSMLKKELQSAKDELAKTGQVSKETMNTINASVEKVDFEKLPISAGMAFNKVESKVKKLESTISSIGDSADVSKLSDGIEGVGQSSDEAEGKTELLIGTLNKFKTGGYVGAIAGIGGAFIAIGKGALDANKAVGELSVQTGATNKELEGMKNVMYDIYSNNFGNDMNDIADVLSTVQAATNLTGKELQKATENTILLRDSFDWEPEEQMNAVRAMMKNFNISQEEAFNLLAQGRQQMGKGADDILDTFKEYGSAFHEIGLSGEDAMNMMNNSMDAGIINTDKAADAINEMSILMREMPDTAVDAMDTIGLSAGDVQEAFSAGGDKAKDMFFKVTKGLKNVENGTERNAAGIGIFGTMWEDAGEEAILALGKTDGAIDKSKNALKQMNDVKYNDIGSALQGVGRAITGNVLLPIQDKLMPAINGGIKLMYRFANGIKGAFDSIRSLPSTDVLKKLGFSNGAANSIINWFNTLKRNLSLAGQSVKGFFQLFKGNGTEGVITLSKLGLKPETIEALSRFADGLKRNFALAFGAISKYAKDGLSSVVKFFQTDGAQILQAVRNIGTVIGAVMKGIWAVMKFVWPAVKLIIVSVWENITGVISGAMQTIKGIIQVFSGLFTGDFKKMWQGIKNIFFGAVKLIWNGVQLLFYGKLLKGALGFAKLFAGGLRSMWTKIVGFFKTFGASIYKGITNNFSAMYKGVNRIFGNLVKWLLNATRGLVRSVVNFFKSLGSGVLKLMTSMKNGLSKTWSLIKTASINAAKAIKDKVWGFFSAMWKSISGLMSRMTSGLSKSWKNIKDTALNAGKNLKEGFLKHFENLKSGVGKFADGIKDSVIGMKDSVIDSAKALAKGLKKHAIGGLNLMIDGINWVAKKLGMDKIPRIEYSEGTPKPGPNPGKPNPKGGHPGGLATVADKGPGNGKGVRELVQFPNGRTALFTKETTFDMPPGTHVWSNKETEPILAAMKYNEGTDKKGIVGAIGDVANWSKHKAYGIAGKAGAKAYVNSSKAFGNEKTNKALKTTAKVGEDIEDIMQFAANPAKLVDVILKKFGVDFTAVKALPKEILSSQFKKIKQAAAAKFKEWFDAQSGGDGGYIDLSHGINFGFMPSAAQAMAAGYPFPRRHLGLDIDYPYGTKVYSTVAGSATGSEGWNGGFGQSVWIKSGVMDVIFGHLSKLAFHGTKQVKPGDFLGLSGGDRAKQGINAGSSSGAHLHYEMRKNGVAFDPTNWLKTNNGSGSIKGGVKGRGTWAQKIRQAAKQMKTSVNESQVQGILAQMQRESNFNETVVQGNIGDINNLRGTPARGILQYVPSTFANYAVKGYGNINDGYHQLLAFFNNANWARNLPYGRSGWTPNGVRRFANGGFTKGESYIAGEEHEEAIIPMDPKRKARANELLAQANYKVNGPIKYASGTPKTHKVKWGDTLWDISRKNNTTVKFLQTLNNIKDHLIYPGQIIKLTKTIDDLGKNVKKHTSTIKDAVTKKPAKPQYKTVKASRADDLLKVATDLIAKANSNPDGKFTKENLTLGKYITDKMKNVNTQALNSLYTNIKAIIKKIDTTVKGNQTKVTKGKSSIVSSSDKNRDANYKIEQLYEEKKLNGATGYINVKTRLADGDTTEVSKQIANQKKKIARSKKMMDDYYKKQAQANTKYRHAKSSRDKRAAKLEMLKAQERVSAWKKQNDKELQQLKKYEQEKYNLQNRYKVTQKKVKGRSASSIDKDIKKQKDLIAKNKKLIATTKSEGKLYDSQIKSLLALKKNEVLRSDFIKKLYKQREILLEKMKALKEKEAALKEEKVSYKSGIVDNLQGYAGFGAAKGNTARDFVEFMKYRLGRVRKFSANMTKLKQMGLDPAILQEMIAGGIESAMPKAEVLIAGGSGYISQINALQAEVNKAVEWIANKQTNNVFDPQIASVQAEIKSNQTQQNALNQQSRDYMNKKTTKKVAITTPKKPATVVGSAKKYVTKTVNKDYKVGKNDSLSSIAKKYGTTVEKLKQLNGLKSNTIKAGQTIKVPMKVQIEVEDKGTVTKKSTKTTTKNHSIKWGDTLSGIAQKYGTTVDELKRYNGLKNDTIITGRTLKIPVRTTVEEIVTVKTTTKKPTTSTASTAKTSTVKKTTTAKKKPTSHTVKAGESLGLIAQRYGITVSTLKSLNKLKSDLIHAGNKLKLPTNIKAYADGGIAVGRQLAWIAEGGFAESIISHDPSKRKEQHEIWRKTGQKLGFSGSDEQVQQQILAVLQEILMVNGEYANKPVAVNFDAQSLAKRLTPHVSNQQAQNLKFKNRGLANNGR